MSEAMENATMNTPAEKAEETKAEKFIRLGEYRKHSFFFREQGRIGGIDNGNRSFKHRR